MEQENLDEKAESSTADVSTESSAVQTEEATSQKATEKEVPFHEHPRWKELQEEKKEARDRADRLERQLFEMTSRLTPQQQQQKVEENIYEAKTPEEKAFWQEVDRRAEKKAAERENKLRAELEEEKKLIFSQTGSILAKDFLKAHPDIEKGSPEMQKIMDKATIYQRAGMSLMDAMDEAYTNVMAPKMVEAARNEEKEKIKQQNKQKLAANVETKTIPQNSMPSQSKGRGITEDDLMSTAKELGFTI